MFCQKIYTVGQINVSFLKCLLVLCLFFTVVASSFKEREVINPSITGILAITRLHTAM